MEYRADVQHRRMARVGVAEALGGLDLAGSEKRVSGLAVAIGGRLAVLREVRRDDEILGILAEHRVAMVAVDAPLGHAEGYRDVDLAARRRGFRLLPPGWRGMRMLVARALRLKAALEDMGVRVIETHPRSALANAGCSYADWARCVERYLDLGGLHQEELGRDLVDALVALAVAAAYAAGLAEAVEGRDGTMWLLPP